MTGKRIFHLLPVLVLALVSLSCASSPKTSILLRDPVAPPKVVQEAFSKEGKSDYFLLRDEGYSFRLIYLCENRVYNFLEEPKDNPVLVSLQPILDTLLEQKLSANDRRRIWACMERKVREEQFHVEELKRRTLEERIRMETELRSLLAEKDRLVAEIEKKKEVEAQKKRQLEEIRKAEEERLRKLEEEQRRKAEEERKIKLYKAGEKEEPPLSPPKAPEGGIFLIMKDSNVYEEARLKTKIQANTKKYDIFSVMNSKKDKSATQWYQVILSERVFSEKRKKNGWSPEERSFWAKNKLMAWVYPGDLTKINTVKPLRLNVEDVQYTGQKNQTSKQIWFEVIYEDNFVFSETILGWVEENNGIHRSNRNKEEMKNLLKDLSKTLWPLRIQNDILRGYIRTGFTEEQVVLSWGRPDHINTTRTLVGVHEQWVYGESPFPNSYVYFENGLVKHWEFIKENGQ